MKKDTLIGVLFAHIVVLCAITVGMIMNNNDSPQQETDLHMACNAGFLFYVTEYKEELDVREKMKRIRDIDRKCSQYVKQKVKDEQ